jgi:hypothetical protein
MCGDGMGRGLLSGSLALMMWKTDSNSMINSGGCFILILKLSEGGSFWGMVAYLPVSAIPRVDGRFIQ